MDKFTSFPAEVVDLILEKLPQKCLLSVSRVNKWLHRRTIRHLYRHIVIYSISGYKSFAFSVYKETEAAAAVKELHLAMRKPFPGFEAYSDETLSRGDIIRLICKLRNLREVSLHLKRVLSTTGPLLDTERALMTSVSHGHLDTMYSDDANLATFFAQKTMVKQLSISNEDYPRIISAFSDPSLIPSYSVKSFSLDLSHYETHIIGVIQLLSRIFPMIEELKIHVKEGDGPLHGVVPSLASLSALTRVSLKGAGWVRRGFQEEVVQLLHQHCTGLRLIDIFLTWQLCNDGFWVPYPADPFSSSWWLVKFGNDENAIAEINRRLGPAHVESYKRRGPWNR